MRPLAATNTRSVVPQFCDLIAREAAKIARAPRTHRATVGDRVLSGLLDVLDRLIEPQYDPKPRVRG